MLYVTPIDPRMMHTGGPDSPQTRHVALQELEHSFLFTLLQEMRKSMTGNGVEPASREKDLYTEMLDDALSSEMSRSGQFGLAKQIERQMEQQSKKIVEPGKEIGAPGRL